MFHQCSLRIPFSSVSLLGNTLTLILRALRCFPLCLREDLPRLYSVRISDLVASIPGSGVMSVMRHTTFPDLLLKVLTWYWNCDNVGFFLSSARACAHLNLNWRQGVDERWAKDILYRLMYIWMTSAQQVCSVSLLASDHTDLKLNYYLHRSPCSKRDLIC